MGLKSISLIVLLVAFLWIFFAQGVLLLFMERNPIWSTDRLRESGSRRILADNVQHYSFIVKEKNFTRLCKTKPLLTVNGTFPGPTITVRRGDTANITVYNEGTYGITIHWHGVNQPRNPWSDGPEYVTQTPIKPRENYNYHVIFSVEEGTLWWHAHSDWSRASVHGAILILPPTGKGYPFHTQPDFDNETIVLGSWFNGDLQKEYEHALRTGGNVSPSDAHTINGWPGLLLQSNCTEGSYNLIVERGKTYLLRIINAVMNNNMFFAIAHHNLTVVGQDGAYTKPITSSYIMITPGQTMDVLITANQSSNKYYMATRAYFDSASSLTELAAEAFDDSTTTGTIEYSDYNPPFLPAYDDHVAADSFTARIKSLATKDYPINVPKNNQITKRVIMTLSVNTLPCNLPDGEECEGPLIKPEIHHRMRSASLNNISFQTHAIDILRAYHCGIPDVYTEDFPERPADFNYTGNCTGDYEKTPTRGTKVISVQYGDGVEITFQGTHVGNLENHPMHLHGFSFYLVGTGLTNYDETQCPELYNLVDPPQINTVGVPKGGWATIRFFADNPGVWFMHCHLERHTSWGMAAVIIVKNATANDSQIMLPPPDGYPAC